MDDKTPYFPYNDENDEIGFDDEMNSHTLSGRAEIDRTQPLDEEEARSYSSVYDMPGTVYQKKRPKQ